MSVVVTANIASSELGIEDLKELMRSVNQTTQRLQLTHAALHRQVARLQGELAEANAQLRRSRSLAALGEMAAGIAHEVRNPLGSIALYVQMLAEDVADRPESAQLCEKIARAVEGLDAIVRDVLLFAKETALGSEPVTAQELIDRALESCRSLLADASVELLTPTADDPLCPLKADPGLIVQSLGNIIRNAVEAMVESSAPRRRLQLAASRQRRRCPDGRRAARIVFSVEDSGPGIDPQALKRMFNPFFTTRKTGTGLGLAIVHRIVDAHGGHVTAANRPDGGARVELCLPPRPVETRVPGPAGDRVDPAPSRPPAAVEGGPATEQGA
ncbi:MAG: sensor histidine kinase [Planctomycetota bacterium]|jgi:signal transduction histidine kinase